jgi:hypothetical protein
MRIHGLQIHRPAFLKPFLHKPKDDLPQSNTGFFVGNYGPDQEHHGDDVARTAALKYQSRASRQRFLFGLLTAPNHSEDMTQLLMQALTPDRTGQPPAIDTKFWVMSTNFDANRSTPSMVRGNIPSEASLELARETARNPGHPCCKDAQLVLDFMTRPVGPDDPDAYQYLATKVHSLLGLEFSEEELKQAEPRTFNSILPSLVVGTQDYGSMGRNLLLLGALQMVDSDTLSAPLQKAMMHFPQNPASQRLTLQDFSGPLNDPLDALDVYQPIT